MAHRLGAKVKKGARRIKSRRNEDIPVQAYQVNMIRCINIQLLKSRKITILAYRKIIKK